MYTIRYKHSRNRSVPILFIFTALWAGLFFKCFENNPIDSGGANNALTYHLSGGTNGSNPDTYAKSSTDIILADPSKTSYVFDGWYSDSVFSTRVTSLPAGSDGNRELWAKWVIKDIDGNIYTEVTIGTQVWSVENLMVTKYNNGVAIPLVTDSSAWVNLSTPGYCFYNNSTDPIEQRKWGAVYNWYTVNTGNLAPAGWRVPTDGDWNKLQNYLLNNGYRNSGAFPPIYDIAKSMAAKTDWLTSTELDAVGNDLVTNNRSGFSALPGGNRGSDGTFNNQNISGSWWTTLQSGTPTAAFYCGLYYNRSDLNRDFTLKQYGFSVRFVRDLN